MRRFSVRARALLPRLAATAAVVTVGATVAVLPAVPALAAKTGDVTAASPSVVPNTGPATIAFTVNDPQAYLPGLPPKVTITGLNGAGTFDGGSVQVGTKTTTQTITATFNLAPAGALPAGPGFYSIEICQAVNDSCTSAPLDDTYTALPNSNANLLTVTASPPSVSDLSTHLLATNAGGANGAPLSVLGSNFAKGDALSFDAPAGATAPSITTPTVGVGQITTKLQPSGATVGETYHLRVTDSAGQKSASGADALTVVSPPTIVSSALAVGKGAGQNGAAPETVHIDVCDLQATGPADAALSFNSGTPATVTAIVDSVTTLATNACADGQVAEKRITARLFATAAATATTLTLVDVPSSGVATQAFTVNAAPTIDSTPVLIGQGSTQVLTLTGTNLTQDTTLTFADGTGVHLQKIDTTKAPIAATVSVDQTATPTHAGFTVRNLDGGSTTYTSGASGTSPIQVTAAPVLTSVSPGNVGAGSSQIVTLTGTGFQNGMTVVAPAVNGASQGVTFGNVNVASPTQATAQTDVDPAASAGQIVIRLTNVDGGSSTSTGLLTIDSFSVGSVTPASASNAVANSAMSISVNGAKIPSGATQLKLTRLPSGASDTTSVAPILGTATAITASKWTGAVDLAAAAPGTYQVQLINGGDTGTCTCTFTVTPALSPSISGANVSPKSAGQGSDITLTIPGTGFTKGAAITLSKSASFSMTGPVDYSGVPTVLKVPVHIAADAATGSANATNITVTNPGAAPSGGSNTNTCTQCLAATAAPKITSFKPATLGRGAATTLTITGTGFVAPTSNAAGSAVTFASGITATGAATVASATTITVPVKVSPSAPGSVTVTVKNPDGGVGSAALPVAAGPTISGVAPQYVATTYADTVTITGATFSPGATVSFPKDSGVAVTTGRTPSVNGNGTSIVVPVTVTRTTPALVDVTVTNADTDLGSAICGGCFGVAVAPDAPANPVATLSNGTASVTWMPVGAGHNGGAPISDYTVSVVEPSGSGIADKKVDGTKTQATFTGLTGNTYTFQVVATNKAGLSSSGANASTDAPATTLLSIQHSAKRIVAGDGLTLSGALTLASGAGVGSATVTVSAVNDAGNRSKVGTATTDSVGRWILRLQPKHNATYRAVFQGQGVYEPASSPDARTVVAPHLSVRTPGGTRSSASDPLRVRGSVAPGKRGRTVRLVAFDSAGVKHVLDTATVSASSTYHFSVALKKGKWEIQVRIGKTPGNVAGHSRRLALKRV